MRARVRQAADSDRFAGVVRSGLRSDTPFTKFRHAIARYRRSRTALVRRPNAIARVAVKGWLGMVDATMLAWLDDRKWAFVRLEGRAFGDVPLNLEYKLEVWDSPNSAGIVIDAVRCAKLALDRGVGGALTGPASYFMKSPPQQYTDAEARERTLEFIAGEA